MQFQDDQVPGSVLKDYQVPNSRTWHLNYDYHMHIIVNSFCFSCRSDLFVQTWQGGFAQVAALIFTSKNKKGAGN
jgi:hypothetical protein